MMRFVVSLLIGVLCAPSPSAPPAQAMTITQLELMGGAVNDDGRHHRMLDRLVGQDGTLMMGQYQAMGELVPSITKGHRTFSLFTSGFDGALIPSATIAGSSITVDLSSLFFGISRGDAHRMWRIGGPAIGLFNPETAEFVVSWDHVFTRGRHTEPATFFLKGKAEFAPQPIAIPASVALYATGLCGLGSWAWWRRRRTEAVCERPSL